MALFLWFFDSECSRPRAARWRVFAFAAATLAGCASAPPPAPSVADPVPAPAPAVSTAPTPSPASVHLPLVAADDADHASQFARWVQAFRVTARAAGIEETVLHSALDPVRWIPRVIELDRSQPEFTRTLWDYLDGAVSKQRLARGQEKLRQLAATVGLDREALVARYGVPLEILVAIWGIESNYGGFAGDIPTIDALATLGFEGRREAWARSQLLAALKILQSGDIERPQMLGSWAGAMGQTQFLPSNFLAFAVDADGDGRRDIWGSVPDVLASTANFLARSGWQAGQGWGTEVRLPSGFDPERADPDARHTTAHWVDAGVQSMDGAPLPPLIGASIWLPAGVRGPAFLVGPNFRTLLRYNQSTSYALAVAVLAQRLGAGPGVQAPWPRDLTALTRSQMLALQNALNGLGFDAGVADGIMGPATRRGIRLYQRSVGVAADGFPTLDLLRRLQPSL